jgi:hypothetical protein
MKREILNTNTLSTLNVFGAVDLRKQSKDVEHRNIVLKGNTYERLVRYKVELVKLTENPKVTFDDAVNDLLDRALQNSSKSDKAK